MGDQKNNDTQLTEEANRERAYNLTTAMKKKMIEVRETESKAEKEKREEYSKLFDDLSDEVFSQSLTSVRRVLDDLGHKLRNVEAKAFDNFVSIYAGIGHYCFKLAELQLVFSLIKKIPKAKDEFINSKYGRAILDSDFVKTVKKVFSIDDVTRDGLVEQGLMKHKDFKLPTMHFSPRVSEEGKVDFDLTLYSDYFSEGKVVVKTDASDNTEASKAYIASFKHSFHAFLLKNGHCFCNDKGEKDPQGSRIASLKESKFLDKNEIEALYKEHTQAIIDEISSDSKITMTPTQKNLFEVIGLTKEEAEEYNKNTPLVM
jgi:hypothetical protein